MSARTIPSPPIGSSTDWTNAVAFLAERPGLGAKRDDLAAGLRHSPVGRYVILYREIPDGVEAVRYLHGARNLSELFQG